MPAAVELRNVRVDFGGYCALDRVDLEVEQGRFLAVVGPTGCGKSSLLNLIAGLVVPTSGEVLSSGAEVRTVNRAAAYMFQSDALFPWKSVLENVQLGPTLRGAQRAEAAAEARRWIERVGLAGLEDRYPHQLSGGQRKRAALAQALINRLPLLLMDEPFSALDAQTRALMEDELLELWRELGSTVLFVTHDLEEAIALADRVVILSAGPSARIKGNYAVDLPRPRNVLEARFIPGFSEIYARVWSDLREEVLAGYAARKRS
jgi:NitT/TauT family transport system ATP-binding protein